MRPSDRSPASAAAFLKSDWREGRGGGWRAGAPVAVSRADSWPHRASPPATPGPGAKAVVRCLKYIQPGNTLGHCPGQVENRLLIRDMPILLSSAGVGGGLKRRNQATERAHEPSGRRCRRQGPIGPTVCARWHSPGPRRPRAWGRANHQPKWARQGYPRFFWGGCSVIL